MSREIKFRGRGDNGWFYGYVQLYQEQYARRLCVCAVSIRNWKDALFYSVDENTVSQSTGLCDKNEKEAYFGDIVKFTPKVLNRFGSDYIETDYDLLAVIDTDEYNHSVLRILNDKGKFKKGDFYHIEGLLKGEIVGNIFDNKELLEE